MISGRYVWFIWVSAFLIPWLALHTFFPAYRKVMLRASLFTTPYGSAVYEHLKCKYGVPLNRGGGLI